MTRLALLRGLLFLGILSLACFRMPVSARETGKKEPAPDKEAQDKAEKLIKTLFAIDYAKRRPSDLLELGTKLYRQALETSDDPVARYVLLRESLVLAARVGDYPAAFKAIEQLDRRYAVSAPKLKAYALEVAAQTGSPQPGFEDLARAALPAVEQALTQDDYDTAQKLVKIALSAAARTKSVPLVTTIQTQGKIAEAQQKEHERLKPDFQTLKEKPDDPEASARVGRFLCLFKGVWDQGLPLLARGNDPILQILAKKDLTAPLDATAQAGIGDGWYELAEGQEGAAKTNLHLRARYWYRQAIAGNLTGLTLTRIKNRLPELDKLVGEQTPTERDDWFVLLRSADPSIWNKDVNKGRDFFAIDLKKAPEKIEYLRLTNTKTSDFVIVPATRAKLAGITDADRYGWNGTNKFEYTGYHLGIYDKQANAPKGLPFVCILVPGAFQGWGGWGFGHVGGDKGMGHAWANVPIPTTVFEIAVKAGPLTEAESRKLLTKK